MMLTPNFAASEFFISDEHPELVDSWDVVDFDVRTNLMYLANRLQVIRDVLNAPIKITSGYRGPKLNEAVDGHPNSNHLFGRAADIVVIGVEAPHVQHTLRHWKGGLGRYSTFTHVDIGPYSRW